MSEFEHSSESNEHYTPPEVVEAARKLLGAIDLDPFSCALANSVVQATEYFHVGGFERPWYLPNARPHGAGVPDTHPATSESLGTRAARVFVNPPGGKIDKDLKKVNGGPGMSTAALAWCKLVHEWEIGNVHSAVFIGFNLEVLRITQQYEAMGIRSCMTFPFCVPKDRLKFWGESTPVGTGSPQYPNVIVGVPPRPGSTDGPRLWPGYFKQLFSDFGQVVLP
jgi:hypothetical protein